jgi:hypothetical protein
LFFFFGRRTSYFKPFYVKGALNNNESDIGQGSDIWQFSISVRRI